MSNLDFTLERMYFGSDATLGILTLGDVFIYTLELPWRNNAQDVSCIPYGMYPIQLIHRLDGRQAVWIKDVPRRSGILIHPANFPHELKGCIAPCMNYEATAGRTAVVHSVQAFNILLAAIGANDLASLIVKPLNYQR